MNKKVVVMGVSGCGKSTIGEMLATEFGCNFYDGDDFHPQANVDKMQSGQPLTDEDRQSWLETLNQLIHDKASLVVACSALKPSYREILCANNPELEFVYLHADFDTIWARMSQREGHYFKGPEMLQSQFDTLIEPTREEALYVEITQTPAEITQTILEKLSA